MVNRREFLTGGLAAATVHARDSRLVQFGQTDLYVTRLCQGTAFRHLDRSPDDPKGIRVLEHCISIGVNFFDSSNAYGWGGAEMALGKAIRGKRDKLIVLTKVSPYQKPMEGEKPAIRQLSRAYLEGECAASLTRLGTDYIDLYLIHNPDKTTSLDSIVETMSRLVKSGKIRYWGVSNHPARDIAELARLGKAAGRARMAGVEDYYNIIGRDRLEPEVFDVLRREKLGLTAFSPIAEGRLAPGRPIPPGTPLAMVADALDRVARKLGVTRPQVCIAWQLARPEVTSSLAGAESTEHVNDNWKGAYLKLPTEMVRELTEVSDRAAIKSPSG